MNVVTKKQLSRRTMLRGLGVAVALPLLDGMVPALTALSRTAAAPIKRFGVVYVPNGMIMEQWTPALAGANFELSPTLSALKMARDRVTVISGLDNAAGGSGGHVRPGSAFLTGVSPERTTGTTRLHLGISLDQLVASHIGHATQLPSLELSLEGTDSNVVATCDTAFSCAYLNISWLNESTPMPREINPRRVFERLFGDAGTTDKKVRLSRLGRGRSVLDSIGDKTKALGLTLGADDNVKLSQYLEAIREVERRIQKAEEQGSRELPVMESPSGVPATYDEHAKLMFDLQVLAYQSDLTRVSSFMLGRELSGATYPQIGVVDAHHPITHHGGDARKIADVAKINAYHVSLFAYHLSRLQATADGDGTLLDNTSIMYGSALSDGNVHAFENVPIMLAGRSGDRFKGGYHLRYPVAAKTPLANLHMSLLEHFEVPVEQFGDSTGRLADIG